MSVNSQKRTITTAFYDAMFGDKPSVGELTALESITTEKVRSVLNNPQQLNRHIPPLPVLMLQLIQLTKDPECNFTKLAQVISQDPSLSGRVLQRANSPAYFRGASPINTLEKAVAMLGLSGVSSIASSIIMEKIKPASPIYYKMFGKQIWDHCIQTAHVCRDFAIEAKEQEFDGYFLGLIHDVGKIVIFDCLCESLASCFEDANPSSHIFKSLMSEMSVDMSVFIAQEWSLPDEFTQALMQQRTGKFNPLGTALFRANLVSEMYLLLQKKMISEEQYQQIMVKRGIDVYYAEGFFEVAEHLAVL